MPNKTPMWTITVTRIGTKPLEIVEEVRFDATTSPLEAEHKLTAIWNGGTNNSYASQPGRFRAKLRRPDGNIYQTID